MKGSQDLTFHTHKIHHFSSNCDYFELFLNFPYFQTQWELTSKAFLHHNAYGAVYKFDIHSLSDDDVVFYVPPALPYFE